MCVFWGGGGEGGKKRGGALDVGKGLFVKAVDLLDLGVAGANVTEELVPDYL